MSNTEKYRIHSVLVLALILFVALTSSGQSNQYILLDKSDSTGIPFAHVLSKKYNTISNSQGKFSIPIALAGDSIRISCVGYETATIIASDEFRQIYLQQETTQLDPVLITSRTPAEILFKAVKMMQQRTGERVYNQEFDYWKGIFENDTLKSYRNANIFSTNGEIEIEEIFQSENCPEFDVSTLSSEKLLPKQNHVFPELACLREENEGLWEYKIISRKITDEGLILQIDADFISPKDYVAHSFNIWLNGDLDRIERITFNYQWNIDHPTKLIEEYNTYSTLTKMFGTVLFHQDLPTFIEATYIVKVCDKFSRDDCKIQKVYHEMKSIHFEANGILDTDYQQQIVNGVKCPE